MHRRQTWTRWYDDFGCRACIPKPASPAITGPVFFAVAAQPKLGGSVRFDLLGDFVESTNLGMRRLSNENVKKKGTLRFDEQYRYQTDVGYVAVRQRALELAMVVDEDCLELGIDRSPTGVASWGDNRRPPLFLGLARILMMVRSF